MRAIDTLPYPITIGDNLSDSLSSFFAGRPQTRYIVVCDVNVLEHAKRLARSIPGRPKPLAFALGERRKRLRTVELVLDTLAAAGADRKTVLVGVGGGVAGDLFGFAAAIYMRGIRFVNIATSIVAMVDASIGGKTGVDLVAGKNLAGVFSDPLAVFASVDTLSTLPLRQLREGIGEVVKHAILAGEPAFARLEQLASVPLKAWPWLEIITESMLIKADIVREDRLEHGRRELLNLGHTFAHGIEFASSYRISHGAAVAIGLRGAGLLAQNLSGFSALEHRRVLALLEALRLPLFDDRISAADILAGMASDKKSRGGALRFVVPHAIGNVVHGVEAPLPEVRAVLKALIRAPQKREYPRGVRA